MPRSPRRRPQPALAISLISLFVALGGTSYAAITVTGKNVKNGSLSGTDIKNGSLSGTDIRNGSLGGTDVRDGSLTGGDLSSATIASLRGSGAIGPAGPIGRAGPTGPTGASGEPGTVGAVTVRAAAYATGQPVTASCLSGEVATGGGVYIGANGFVRVSGPIPPVGTPTGWQGQSVNASNAAVASTVYAVCAKR